jgi:hypothetical protein
MLQPCGWRHAGDAAELAIGHRYVAEAGRAASPAAMTQGAPLYRGHRYPAAVIAQAIWLYFRFPLSLRMVEELLAERGIEVVPVSRTAWRPRYA